LWNAVAGYLFVRKQRRVEADLPLEDKIVSWQTLVTILPQIASAPTAIVAYIVLVVAALLAYLRKRKSEDWAKLVEAAGKNPEGMTKLAEKSRYAFDLDGKLQSRQLLQLRLRQLRAGIIVCAVIAVALVASAAIQALSGAREKSALLEQMTAEAAELRRKVDVEGLNKARVMGDLGEIEGRLRQSGATLLAAQLRETRQRFATTIGTKYITQRDADQLTIIDATIAFAEHRLAEVNAQLTEAFLSRLTDQAESQIAMVHELSLIAMVTRLQAKDYVGAIQCADRILRLAPGNWFTTQVKANALFLSGKHEEAVTALGQLNLDSSDASVNWISPGDVRGKFDAKSTDLSKSVDMALSGMPHSSSFHLLGVISWKRKSPCELPEYVEREQFARHWLAGELTSVGRYDDARALLQRGYDKCSSDPRIVSELAMTLLRLNNHSAAVPLLHRWVELEPNGMGFLLLGLGHLALKEPQEAITALAKARKWGPKDENVAFSLAHAYELAGNEDLELKTLTSYLALNWSVRVAKALEAYHAKRENHRGVISIGNEILARNEADAQSRFNRGLSYFNLQQFDKALPDFVRLVELEPKHLQGQFNLAMSAGYLKQWELSEKHARLVLAANPDFNRGAGYYLLALAKINLNRNAEAIADVQELVRRNGDNVETDYLNYFALEGVSGKPEAKPYCDRLREHVRAKTANVQNVPVACGGKWRPAGKAP